MTCHPVARAAALFAVAALVLLGCSPAPSAAPTTPASGSPTSPQPSAPSGTEGAPEATDAATETAAPAELVLGCFAITDAECQFLARRIIPGLPAERGPAFAVEIQLFRCENEAAPCPPTLDARRGKAVIEFLDGEAPLELSLQGPALNPTIAEQDAFYLGLTEPSSAPAGGPGPFPFEIGHCGITHVIDFDASFWVPVGQVDGDHPTVINAEAGHIRLLGPNLAEFRGESGFTVQLARFPGPKHFWGCD